MRRAISRAANPSSDHDGFGRERSAHVKHGPVTGRGGYRSTVAGLQELLDHAGPDVRQPLHVQGGRHSTLTPGLPGNPPDPPQLAEPPI